jgi:hypothetical protein
MVLEGRKISLDSCPFPLLEWVYDDPHAVLLHLLLLDPCHGPRAKVHA